MVTLAVAVQYLAQRLAALHGTDVLAGVEPLQFLDRRLAAHQELRITQCAVGIDQIIGQRDPRYAQRMIAAIAVAAIAGGADEHRIAAGFRSVRNRALCLHLNAHGMCLPTRKANGHVTSRVCSACPHA